VEDVITARLEGPAREVFAPLSKRLPLHGHGVRICKGRAGRKQPCGLQAIVRRPSAG
jgi:hypothetical protein